MPYKKIKKIVYETEDGREVEEVFSDKPSNAFTEWEANLKKYRELYPEAFARLPSTEEFIKMRREEAAREWL